MKRRASRRHAFKEPPPPTAQKSSLSVREHLYRCPDCGAELLFEPQGGVLACAHCGRREQLPQSGETIREHAYEDYLKVRPEALRRIADDALEAQCQNCGAIVAFIPPLLTSACDFCATPYIAQPKAASPLLAPESLLPFSLSPEEAPKLVTEWLASRMFAPGALRKKAELLPTSGVYLPYWTYDAHTTTSYMGYKGRGFQDVKVKAEEVGRKATGQVSRWFDDVTIPATKTLPQERLNELEPWDLSQLKPYHPAHLSGFKAQRYQMDFVKGFEHAKEFMVAEIRVDVSRALGGFDIRSLKTHYSGIRFKHVLLPVYVAAFSYEGVIYQVVVNGRTGETHGERPYSAVKIILFILSMLLLLWAAYYTGLLEALLMLF